MSNLYYYRDNILNKIKTNKKIEDTLKFLSYFSKISEEVEIVIDRKHKIKMDKEVLEKILMKLKDENNEHIDRYLALSFDSENYYKKLAERNKNE